VPAILYRQWFFGSPHEASLAQQFQAARVVNYDPDESDPEGHAVHRNSYSRELKLAGVEWSGKTYVKGKKDGDPSVLQRGLGSPR
jgi:hypothetical protein